MDNNANLNEVSRISAGTAFKGEVTTSGDIRIDGKFDGRLSSKGRLVVGEGAQVNGDVICQNVDFSGKMSKGTSMWPTRSPSRAVAWWTVTFTTNVCRLSWMPRSMAASTPWTMQSLTKLLTSRLPQRP